MSNKLALIGDNLDVFKMGDVFVKSGYFTDAKDAAQAVVKILAGAELGIGPVTAMKELNIIKGKISLSASLIAARIKSSGRYDYRVTSIDSEKCIITFFEQGKNVGVSEFTMKDAAAANLLANETYKKFPRNMLFSRALTNGARWYCADVFNGAIYTPDELGGVMPEPTGEIVEQPKDEPRAAELPAPKAEPETPPTCPEHSVLMDRRREDPATGRKTKWYHLRSDGKTVCFGEAKPEPAAAGK